MAEAEGPPENMDVRRLIFKFDKSRCDDHRAACESPRRTQGDSSATEAVNKELATVKEELSEAKRAADAQIAEVRRAADAKIAELTALLQERDRQCAESAASAGGRSSSDTSATEKKVAELEELACKLKGTLFVTEQALQMSNARKKDVQREAPPQAELVKSEVVSKSVSSTQTDDVAGQVDNSMKTTSSTQTEALLQEEPPKAEAIPKATSCTQTEAAVQQADAVQKTASCTQTGAVAEEVEVAVKTATASQTDAVESAQMPAEKVQVVEGDSSQLRAELESSCAELSKLRQRETTLAAQVASIMAPVSVMCRTRPLESYPRDADGATQKSALQVRDGQIFVEGSGTIQKRNFIVDRVLEGGQHSQEDVFGSVAPWIENVMGGRSSCIMAYGATGSGKTFTVLGKDGSPGIAHHALRRLIDGRPDGEVKLSMVEVYLEQIRDLLADSSNRPVMLQHSRRQPGGPMVLDCAEVIASDYSKAEELLQIGFSNRASDATLCNDQSSRSHVVLTVEACASNGSQSSSSGRLVLVDLAGSENIQKSGADEGGSLLAEAKAINKSLSALADVVEALAKRQSFVPYRNSRLTLLLQDTLAVSKVCLLVHASPLLADVGNTGHSLQFAGRIRAVDFGAQQLRKDQEDRLKADANRKAQENSKLQAELDERKKECALSQQREQDAKQQLAKVSEELRTANRNLIKEQEMRSKLEASNREIKKGPSNVSTAESGVVGRPASPLLRRPASPLLRQQGPAAAATSSARRLAPPSNIRKTQESIPEEAKTRIPPPRHAAQELQAEAKGTNEHKLTLEPKHAPRTESNSTTRQPLTDLTNHEDKIQGDGKTTLAKMLEVNTVVDPAKKTTNTMNLFGLAMDPEAAAAENNSILETPVKQSGESGSPPADANSNGVHPSPQPSPIAVAQSPLVRLRIAADEAMEVNARPVRASSVKPILRKIPTNFTERLAQHRSASCPTFGGSRLHETRIQFAEQLQEASSPPKWYFGYREWLDSGDISGRRDREAKAQSLVGRDMSPRRKREVRDAVQTESGIPRWR